MPYTRVNWADSPSTTTPVDAANLNNMDAYIATLDGRVGSGTQAVGINANVQGAAGLIDNVYRVQVGGVVHVYIADDVYLDSGGTWHAMNANQGHIYDFSAGFVQVYVTPSGQTAGAAVTATSEGYLAKLTSVGGGSVGPHVWEGTTDPASFASEGDLWFAK